MARSYRAEAVVPASSEAVWAVLADLPSYGAWNPFTPEVRGRLEVGADVTMRVVMGPGREVIQRERVLDVVPGRRVSWGVTRPPRWLLWAERVQTVEPVDDGTRYVTVDTIGGALGPLVHALYGRALHAGFTAMAAALAERVRSLAA